MPVKRVQSFEFYGADAQPKPARKGVERGGVARTHRRGVSEGGYTWAILYEPMFPQLLACHRWSNSQHLGLIGRRTEVRISAKSKREIQKN